MKKLYCLLCVILLVSCKKDTIVPVSIGFVSASSEAVESAGTQSIAIQFDRATDEVFELTFTVSGDAALNGDYRQTTISPLSVPVGVTSISIDLDLIDENIIEDADKTLVFTLTSTTSGLLKSGGILTHTFTLKDNDGLPANSLQFDLTWDLGSGVDIDQVDLDLILITNLVESGGTITDFDVYGSGEGENENGFETVFLDNTAPDNDYYALILYYEGSQSVDFALAINGTGFGGDANGTFSGNDEGSGLIVGPVIKTGNSYSGRMAREKLQMLEVSDHKLNSLQTK